MTDRAVLLPAVAERPQARAGAAGAFEFTTYEFTSLPPSAWCLHLSRASFAAMLVHGTAVEVRDGLFVEGVWDGSWDSAPIASNAFFGTGGVVTRDHVEIYTSNFKLHGVFTVLTAEQLFVSNSLPLLLARSGCALLPNHQYVRQYYVAVSLAWRGITAGLNAFPVAHAADGVVRLYTHCRLTVRRDAVAAAEAVPHYGPRFPQTMRFREYRDAMESTLARMIANASARGRKTPLDAPIVAMSAGYDSTAVAVLASRVGCALGVTIDDGSGDSGEPIGRRLGFAMHVAPLCTTRNTDEMASVVCMPGNRLHTPWFAMKPYFANRIVVTGWHGDTNWALRPASAFSGEFASMIGAGGLPEARLWMNCAFVALPAIGDGDQHHLVAMSCSDEMQPYRTGQDYDRPIPRRLAADAGVDALLAPTKMGSTAHFFVPADPAIRAELERLMNTLSIPPPPAAYLDVEALEFSAAGWNLAATVHTDQARAQEFEVWLRWGLEHLVRAYTARLAALRLR